MRNIVASAFKNPAIRLIAAALLAGTAAGCSSDATRFDSLFSSTDTLTTSSINQSRANAVNGQVPIPSANVATAQAVPSDLSDPLNQPFPTAPASGNLYGSSGMAASNVRPASGGIIQRSELSAPSAAPVARKVAAADTQLRTQPLVPKADPIATGTVKAAPALKKQTEMKVASLEPKVQKPAPVPMRTPTQDAAIVPAAPQPEKKKSAASTAGSTTANASGYKVVAGDSLAAIARRSGVSVDALKAANGLKDSNIRVGQTLNIPAAGAPAAKVASAKPAVADDIKTSTIPAKADDSAKPKPYTPPVDSAKDSAKASAKESVTSAADAKVASVAPAETGIGKYRWPVTGAVIAGYGANVDGRRNDGIDISVPEGTPVKAAENGVVIYAGNGLEKLGNTVLVRHSDGTVTVYAHAEKLDVNRGDKVTRGQVIAASGMSGDASRPKLHFEVRKNSAPVNPMTFLE